MILLMQDLHRKLDGGLPEVDDLVEWLRRSGVLIRDGDDEHDSVGHSNLEFLRVDAFRALDAMGRALQQKMLLTGEPLGGEPLLRPS